MLENCVIFKNNSNSWVLFNKPVEIIRSDNYKNIKKAFSYIEDMTLKGFYVAGFLSYEASRAFDPNFSVNKKDYCDEFWFGIFKKKEIIPHHILFGNLSKAEYFLNWELPFDYQEYKNKIDFIKEKIFKGDIYQLNYTFNLKTDFKDDPFSVFFNNFSHLDSKYSAFIDTPDFSVLSGSPELFFKLDKNKLISKPMKGTIQRGRNNIEDSLRKNELYTSEKDRAENVMITDMIRNDMGKIAEISSVNTDKLFEIEKYSRVFQMTSKVTCTTDKSVCEIFEAMFPCASITGAPKIKSMEYINHTEKNPRGVYTGTIGFIEPGRKSLFNVAIRTMYINKQNKKAFYGTGGGIVWDSSAKKEYKECQSKALIISEPEPEFKLLETLLYIPGNGFYLEKYHIKRILDSAEYFSFELKKNNLLQFFKNFRSEEFLRVRLLCDRFGNIEYEENLLEKNPLDNKTTWKICLADEPVDSKNRFLYHKTTNRSFYNNILKKHPEFNDIVLFNENNNITETCFANIVIKKNEKLYTPFSKAGLLPGTMRNYLLDKNIVSEKMILKKDLKNADKIYLINSVRGFINADMS
ncbi:MAG: chorismate-binding protein [Thermodesulfobacteriota bacterium]